MWQSKEIYFVWLESGNQFYGNKSYKIKLIFCLKYFVQLYRYIYFILVIISYGINSHFCFLTKHQEAAESIWGKQQNKEKKNTHAHTHKKKKTEARLLKQG